MRTHCDLDLEDCKPVLSHATQAYDDAPPCQVWLQKVERFRRIFWTKRWHFWRKDTLIPEITFLFN